MENNILSNIDETICINETIKDLAKKTTLIDSSDTANWIEVDGNEYGIGLDGGGIMYSDGTPVSDEFEAQNWELVEVLRAANNFLKK